MHHAQMKPSGDTTETNLNVQSGIVVGRVTEYAQELETSCDAVLDAVEGIALLVDTTQNKARETHDRPTDPSMRCLAMTRDAFARVLAAVQ